MLDYESRNTTKAFFFSAERRLGTLTGACNSRQRITSIARIGRAIIFFVWRRYSKIAMVGRRLRLKSRSAVQ